MQKKSSTQMSRHGHENQVMETHVQSWTQKLRHGHKGRHTKIMLHLQKLSY